MLFLHFIKHYSKLFENVPLRYRGWPDCISKKKGASITAQNLVSFFFAKYDEWVNWSEGQVRNGRKDEEKRAKKASSGSMREFLFCEACAH